MSLASRGWYLSRTKLPSVGTQQHYESCKIEPIDFIVANNMNFLEGNIIKYVTRYKEKNGFEDLQKAEQYLVWLIEDVIGAEYVRGRSDKG